MGFENPIVDPPQVELRDVLGGGAISEPRKNQKTECEARASGSKGPPPESEIRSE